MLIEGAGTKSLVVTLVAAIAVVVAETTAKEYIEAITPIAIAVLAVVGPWIVYKQMALAKSTADIAKAQDAIVLSQKQIGDKTGSVQGLIDPIVLDQLTELRGMLSDLKTEFGRMLHDLKTPAAVTVLQVPAPAPHVPAVPGTGSVGDSVPVTVVKQEDAVPVKVMPRKRKPAKRK